MRLSRDEHAPTPVQEFAAELVVVARATIHGQAQESSGCSGQPIPDSGLSFSSATAGGNPSLN